MTDEQSPVRILIVDDHPIVRRGLRDLLETEDGILVVGEAANGLQAVQRTAKLQPDLILMDLVMPEMDGIEATRRIKAENPDIQVLVLTSFATDDKVFPAIKAGALGYLIKDTGAEELLDAIQRSRRGEPTLHPTIAQKVLAEISGPSSQPPTPEPLTERELEVLQLVARGLNNQEIASTLVISPTTVYTHVSNILSKLHLASRTQAALYALREGLASLYESEDPDVPGQ